MPASPFRLMHMLFAGLLLSVCYGTVGSAILRISSTELDAAAFFYAYTSSFRTMLSLGLIVGTAMIVLTTQQVIPGTIESSFSRDQLKKTDYFEFRRRFNSVTRSVSLAGFYATASYAIFTYCGFPLSDLGQELMMIAACLEYAFGVYVGRKLFYAGMMLHSIQDIEIDRNLFKDAELDPINNYVNIVSALTMAFVYINLTNYLWGPFDPEGLAGKSAHAFVILLAVVATPVLLIFNFYPRIVLRRVYAKSIELELRTLRERLRMERLSFFERQTYLMDFARMSRDELRVNLRLTLADLPIVVTIVIMLVGPLLGH